MKRKMTAVLLVLTLVSAIAATAFAAETPDEAPAETTETAETTGKAEAAEENLLISPAPADAEESAEDSDEDAPIYVDAITGEPLEEDEKNTIVFGTLEDLIKKNNTNYHAASESINAMESLEEELDRLKGVMASAQADLMDPSKSPAEKAAAQMVLETAMSEYTSVSGMVQSTSQMEAGCKQIIYGAESLFLVLGGLEQQEQTLVRQLDALERTAEEMKVRAQWGQVSPLQLAELEVGRGSLVSGLTTLRMNISNYKMHLEQMLGLKMTGATKLGSLPAITKAEWDAIDLEKDLKLALQRNLDIEAASDAEDKMDLMPATGSSEKVDGINSLKDAAYFSYQAAREQTELKFRMLHAQLVDCRQVLAAAEAAYANEQDVYAAAELKYKNGTISKNALLTAEDELKTARDAVWTARREQFTTYNNYRWAVDRGILN